MSLQILIVILFALNFALAWLWRKSVGYNLLASLIFVVLPLATVFFPQPKFALDYYWWKIAGLIAIIFGLALALLAQKTLGKVWPDLTLTPADLRKVGPYQFFRHPIYLGLIFIDVGWWWVWSAVYSFYFGMFIIALIWLQAYFEEKLILEEKFGNLYRVYRSETGMFWIK
ncbi:isoprenylcysteine carboxylmethyltransferase family protein [Candidatus Saganbacteria bacterium]|nr:isoprenylcysteine carboxylmethyltransferase family protein [Candidatus Saganbacteria bacterium]